MNSNQSVYRPTDMLLDEAIKWRSEWDYWRGYIIAKVPKKKLSAIYLVSEDNEEEKDDD